MKFAWTAAFLLFFAEPEFGQRSDPREPAESAEINVHASRQGCAVDLDGVEMGTTDNHGTLTLANVERGDHYIHVRCPPEIEQAFFLSLRAGERRDLQATPSQVTAPPTALEAAQARIELQKAIQRALHLRAAGHLEEAVALLHEASRLDPQNSDLHRELGITFLLGKNWKRARVEMIEALRRDPQDADAHNGLGYALEKLGNLDSALQEYRNATRLDPDDPSYREHYWVLMAKLASRQVDRPEKKK